MKINVSKLLEANERSNREKETDLSTTGHFYAVNDRCDYTESRPFLVVKIKKQQDKESDRSTDLDSIKTKSS